MMFLCWMLQFDQTLWTNYGTFGFRINILISKNKACEILRSISKPVDLADRESLLSSVDTCLSSKVVGQNSEVLSPIGVAAHRRSRAWSFLRMDPGQTQPAGSGSWPISFIQPANSCFCVVDTSSHSLPERAVIRICHYDSADILGNMGHHFREITRWIVDPGMSPQQNAYLLKVINAARKNFIQAASRPLALFDNPLIIEQQCSLLRSISPIAT